MPQLPGRLSLLFVIVVVTGAWAQEGGGPPAQPVVVAPLTQREIPATLRVVGTIDADKSAVVAAEVSGVLDIFSADEGAFLQRGDVIARIDPNVAELRLAEARAVLGSYRAQLEELENGTRKEILDRLRAAKAEAEAILEKWKFEKERMDRLYGGGTGSSKEKHDADMEFIAAQGRLAQAQAELDEAVNGPRAEEIARARQNVAAQEAVVARLQRDLDKTVIRAPFTGFVVAQMTEAGEWIQAGGSVAEMVDVEIVTVRVDIPEYVVRYARPGANATIEVEALGKTIPAKVARLIPQAQRSARTFPLEIDLENRDHTLLPGMFVRAHIPAGELAERLMAPADAIVSDGLNRQVFVIRDNPRGPGKMAMPTPVHTGLQLAGEVEVESAALQPGDLVVIRANERLMGPSPVQPISADATPADQPQAAAPNESDK